MADTRTREPITDGAPADPPSGGSGYWTSRWTIAAIVVLAIVAGCGLWLLVSDPADPGPRPVAVSTPQGDGDGCGPAAGSQIPPLAPPATDWTLLGTMAAPTADAVGPADDAGGVPVCFARDPLGALFTAGTFIAAVSDPDLRFAAVKHLTADTEGRTNALADIALRGPGDVTTGVQITGFAFQSYVPEESAVIDLSLASEGVDLHVPIELVWAGDDWDVVLPVTGDAFAALAPLPSLAGYIQPWRGA